MHHDTAMDYLHRIVNKYTLPKNMESNLDIDEVIDMSMYDYGNVRRDNVNKIINMLTDFLEYSHTLFKDHKCGDKYKEYMETKNWMYNQINQLTLNTDTLIAVYRKLKKDEKLKKYLITVLFNIGNHEAFDLIKESSGEIPFLIKDDSGDIDIYGRKYSKIYKKPQK